MFTDSILTSVKKMLGIEKDYEHFDPELIMHINSVFATLAQLGVGPSKAFSISSDDQTWSEFCTDKNFQNVKTYIYLRLRLIWDPPSNSFAVKSFETQIKELEWRMNVQAESDDDIGDYEKPSTSVNMFITPEDGKLPEVGESNVIYSIPNDGRDPGNEYTEYYWNPDKQKFELLGPEMEEMSSEEFDEIWNKKFKGE